MLGCAGAGKSVFSRELADALTCPAFCLDEVWGQVGGETRLAEFKALVAEQHRGEHWVSDGNFSEATFVVRLPRATHIIWIERPRWLCLLRAALRPFEPAQAHRIIDIPKVSAFIWNFNVRNRPRIDALIRDIGPSLPVTRLGSDEEVRHFLKSGFRKLVDNGVEGIGGEDVKQPQGL